MSLKSIKLFLDILNCSFSYQSLLLSTIPYYSYVRYAQETVGLT